MAAAFHAEGHRRRAPRSTCSCASLPTDRDFLVAVRHRDRPRRLEALPLRADDDLDYLRHARTVRRRLPRPPRRASRFDGDVRAMTEGELVYAGEPLLSVTAPIVEAQLVETLLINTVGARDDGRLQGGPGHAGLRRPPASSTSRPGATTASTPPSRVARAATSAVPPAPRWSWPAAATACRLSGTMAHCYVMAHDDEIDAFRSFLRALPGGIGPADRHLRHRSRAPRAAAVAAMDGEGCRPGRAPRLRRPRRPRPAGPARSSTTPAHERSDPRVGRPRRGPDRRAAWRRSARSTPSASAPGWAPAPTPPISSVVYKLVEHEGEPRVKLVRGQEDVSRPQAGVAAARRRTT